MFDGKMVEGKTSGFAGLCLLCSLLQQEETKGKWRVLVRITIAVMENHGQKASLGGKSLLGLYLHITVYHWRKSGHKLKQDRNLEAELIQRSWKGASYWLLLLTGSAWFL